MRPLPRLFAFTDHSIRTSPQLGANAAAIASLGPPVALVARDHRAGAADLTAFTARLIAIARPSEAAVIVSSRPDVAASLGAQGVQLRLEDLAPTDARRVMPYGWIGRSVHTAAEGAEAVAAGAEYLVAGSIWESASHPGQAAAGLGLIEALTSLGKPVIAIGGVDVHRVQEAKAAGAYGVAAIRALWSSRNPSAVATELLDPWLG
jgi:thiazole tautomerase (transcriptional regulator TenI)